MEECSFCGRRAVYFQRTAGVNRCDRCFEENIEKRFHRTVTKNDLIEPGDRIVAAVSGGSDSVANLNLIAHYSRFKKVEVISLTIDEGIRGYRDGSIPIARENSNRLDVEHLVISFEEVFGSTLDELAEISQKKDGPTTCTLCGILRRSLLNQSARELEADKLAVGHNLDDETQTIMLNYVRGDMARLRRLGPKSEGKKGFVPRIKPLREIKEKEIAIYAMLKDLDIHAETCPYMAGMRSEVREFVNKMEKNHPTTKFKILRMFDKMKPHLPVKSNSFNLKECKICGEPSADELCRSCELLKNLGIERRKKTLIS